MSRPLRLQFSDAWYHIMNRGRRGEQIFLDRRDYFHFIDLLQDTSEMWNLRIAAYCLMPNHYHLLVQTPDANISRCMRHIGGVYTQFFNRRYSADGPLFRGRFKSILVEADYYLLQLVKYIHQNPLKAGLTDQIGKYPWTSHNSYLYRAEKWNWLYRDFILSMLAPQKNEQRKRYQNFISADNEESEAVNQVIERKKWPSMLGSKKFVEQIKEKFFLKAADDEIPQSKELAPSHERIKDNICLTYHIHEHDLMRSKRGTFNEPRNVAIYLTRQLTGDSLKMIAERYRINKYSTVSSVIARVKAKMATDRKFRKKVEILRSAITAAKSQEQT